jgi:hypothetical protein
MTIPKVLTKLQRMGKFVQYEGDPIIADPYYLLQIHANQRADYLAILTALKYLNRL